ncbi:MAG TPA: MerR family transcriptional regulator [Candidatus Dojkabacteria bacterium]
MKNKKYTVKQLADLAGVTERTLRHYDEIDILNPQRNEENNYRNYSHDDLLKLQQILFFREIGFDLEKIKEILGDKNFDLAAALENHKKFLQSEQKRMKQLVATVEKTILHIKENTMVTDEDLYEGFTKEEVKVMKEEVKEKYDPRVVAESNKRVKAMTKAQFQKVKEEGIQIILELAEASKTKNPGDKEVQDLVKRQYEHIRNFYEPTMDIFKGLGELYVSDSRFTQNYDQHKKGLAQFFKEAIDIFVERNRMK